MNLSNFKLGIYDLHGLVIPGMILVCEGGITLRGWVTFRTSLSHLSGTSFTFLLVVSFVLGHLVQELADVSIKRIKGPRFFATGRDEFWAGPEAEAIKSAVCAESGVTLGSVDAIFDAAIELKAPKVTLATRQEQLEADLARAWSRDPLVDAQGEVYPRYTRRMTTILQLIHFQCETLAPGVGVEPT